jgi:hypothetical protein
MTTRAVSESFKRGLLEVIRMPSYHLAALEPHWSQVEKQIKKTRQELAREIPNDDPIRLPIDLLTPLGRIADETLHTRAIAYLLDNNNEHGFRKDVLSSLLEKVRNIRRGTGASQVLALVHRQRTKISVTPEYRYLIEGFRNRSVARIS